MPRNAAFAGVAALVVWFIACTWTGVNFGGHWDEIPWCIDHVSQSMLGKTVLPPAYMHPSFLHEITLATAVITGEDAARLNTSKPFLLRMRRIIAVISSLTIVWVFLGVLVWRNSPLEALLAAAVAAGSWELQYHSRWLTVDPLMVSFGALTLCCVIAAHRRQSTWLFRASAIAAGLACGAKYTAGLLLLCVLLACWFNRERVRRIVESLVLFAAAFLFTTPGAVFEPGTFLDDVVRQSTIYATGWGVYSAAPGLEFASLLGPYVGLVMLSHTQLIAAFLTAAAIGGAIVVAREDRRAALIVVSFPIVFLLYFTTRRVLIVRNVLVVIPFLAALAGIGLGWLIERGMRTRELRLVVAAAVGVMLVINLAWLWTAARTIGQPPQFHLTKLAQYLDENSDRRFALSPSVAAELRALDGRDWRPTPYDAPGIDAIVIFLSDSPITPVLSNRRDSIETWFGAHEVNLNYYPSWGASDRVVVLRPEKVRWLRRRSSSP